MSAFRPLAALVLITPTLAVAQQPPAGLEEQLREEGATLADLESDARAGEAGPWRLASVDGLLASPLTLEPWVEERAKRLERDLPGLGGLPGWEGFFGLATEELQPGRWTDPCVGRSLAELGLVDHHVAWETERGNRMSRREVKALREGLSPALDTRLGRLVSEADRARCRLDEALKELTPEGREATVAAVGSLLAGLPPGTLEAQEAVATLEGAWKAIDGAGLLAAGRAWTEAVDAATLELAAVPEIDWPTGPAIYSTRHGELWIGSFGHNSGTGDPFAVVDPGGDDVWRIGPDQAELPKAGARAVRGWIDLGGDDLWQGGAASAGGALLSLSAGVDVGGDDVWRLGDLSGGAAAFGVATWLDGHGGDLRSVGVGGQGFATFGVAAVRDRGDGGDVWEAIDLAQGVGLPMGFGLLHDEGGDDRLSVVGRELPEPAHGDWTMTGGQGLSLGLHPLIGGGLGWLLDGGGDDVRTAASQAQGGCSGGGIGVAWDRAGDDLWRASSRGQAAAGLGCVAALFDDAGDDALLGGRAVQGYAERRSVAWLRDGGGGDGFTASLDSQGWAGPYSVAVLVDEAGRDFYAAAPMTQGWTLGRPGLGIGALVDIGRGPDARVRLEPELEGRTTPAPRGDGVSADEAGDRLRLAASGQVEPRQVIHELEGGGAEVLAVLLPGLSEDRPAEVELVRAAIVRLARHPEPARAGELARLLADDALAREPTDATCRRHLDWLHVLAEEQPSAVAEDLVRAATGLQDHPAWPVRRAVVRSFAILASSELEIDPADLSAWEARAAIVLQNERRPELREAALDGLAVYGGAGVAAVLVHALWTDAWGGRRAAERALEGVVERTDGLAVARALFPVAAGEEEASLPVREAALRLLGSTGHREAWDVLEPALMEGEPRIRLAAAIGARRLGGRQVERALAERAEFETDPAVLEVLRGE